MVWDHGGGGSSPSTPTILIIAGVAQLVEQLICNQQVAGSSPIASSIFLLYFNMEEFPSGQRGQTVNLLLVASVVRIHPLPPKVKITALLSGYYFFIHENTTNFTRFYLKLLLLCPLRVGKDANMCSKFPLFLRDLTGAQFLECLFPHLQANMRTF